MRVILTVCITLLLSGCFGVQALSGATYHQDGCSDGSAAVGIGEAKYKLSVADMEKVYGKPAKIVTTATGQQWFYPDGRKWRGVLVYVIVPIPLALPTGRDYHIVNFKKNWCDSEDYQMDMDEAHGFRCGFLGDRHGAMAFQCGNA